MPTNKHDESWSPYLTYRVTGFRSLRNTEFRLNSGLNVIVGSNGSGKTNVTSLIDFLSTFIDDGVYAALAKSGGALRAFSVEDIRKQGAREARLTITVTGALEHVEHSETGMLSSPKKLRDEPENQMLEFDYHLALILDRTSFDVRIRAETISWRRLGLDGSPKGESHKVCAAETAKGVQCTVKLSKEDAQSRFQMIAEEFREEIIANIVKPESTIGTSIAQNAKSGQSLLQFLVPFYAPELMTVRRALGFERSFNISPAKVKDPEDIASTDELESDGSGVVSTLFSLKQSRDEHAGKRKKRAAPGSRASMYDRIVAAFTQINDQVSDIKITPDLATGRLQALTYVGGGQDLLEVPFQSLSDGTVKWLAMLTIMRVTSSSYCIEEPENYLHPAAQRKFIEVMYDLSAEKRNPFYVITTHSETIVNAIRPEQLMICEYTDTGTTLTRVTDPASIMDAINESGFGLGFLYANDRV